MFRRGDGHALVVVRVERDADLVALRELPAEPLDEVGVLVGGPAFDGGGQVEDHGLGLGGLAPGVEDALTDLQREGRVGVGELLGAELDADIAAGHGVGEGADLLDGADAHVEGLLAGEPEDLVHVEVAGGAVHVEDGSLDAGEALEGAGDQVLAGLGERHDEHVVGDQRLLDEAAREVEVVLTGGGKGHFDVLEAHAAEQAEVFELLLGIERVGQGLVAVAQVDGAPLRGAGDGSPGPLAPGHVDPRRRGVLDVVVFPGHGRIPSTAGTDVKRPAIRVRIAGR